MNENVHFTLDGAEMGLTINDFWMWGCSDLLDNAIRNRLAEFLVHSALRIDSDRPLPGAFRCDVISPSGRCIAVRSAAYVQSSSPDDVCSHVSFAIGASCDLYVFAVFSAMSRGISALDLDYWDFYVLPAGSLGDAAEKKTLSLSSLSKLAPIKTGYAGLGDAIESINL